MSIDDIQEDFCIWRTFTWSSVSIRPSRGVLSLENLYEVLCL